MNWMAFVAENALLVSMLGALVVALIVVESRRGGEQLSHHDVTRLLNSDTAVALDVRDKKDYQAGHVAGALNIPFAKLKDGLGQLEKHKSKTVVVIDKMGQHSAAAATTLTTGGYDAKRMRGGMMDWKGQNLPVIKS